MLIGILEAETLHPSVVAQYGSYGDMFCQLLGALDSNLQFKYYAVDQWQLPADIHECDAYIVTGSRHNSYDNDPWLLALREFIQTLHQHHIKMLGICFGHQVIAEALGGKVEKYRDGWHIGATEFVVAHHPKWVPNEVEIFSILVSHQDQVLQLPPEASLFATNSFCVNGGYFIDNHVFCLQGHPEFTTGYLRFLLAKRETVFPPHQYSVALNSLEVYRPQTMVTQWLLRFFYAI